MLSKVSDAVGRLLEVMGEVRALVARPGNDFGWSGWTDSQEALEEIDPLLGLLEAGALPPLANLTVLFLPTGPLQELSLSSGWGDEYVELASRFDDAVSQLYAG